MNNSSYRFLVEYFAKGNRVANYSPIGKGLICRYCGSAFDAHPHKVREGKAKFCSLDCYNKSRHNPDRNRNLKARFTKKYKEWKRAVLERDNFTCQECKRGTGTGVTLAAHHIEHFSKNLKLRTSLSNGITLCRECHYRLHHGRDIQYGICPNCGGKRSQRAKLCRNCDNARRRKNTDAFAQYRQSAITMYQSGKSLRDIGRLLNRNHKSILNLLRKAGVVRRPRIEAERLHYGH